MSKIEWTNETWNPITGCSKKSEGCLNCYAEKMHKRLTAMGQEKYKFAFENVLFHYEELSRKLSNKPKMFFVNSMSDTFNEKISGEQILKILTFCRKYHQHVFQILTKRAERLPDFGYPFNVWLGVTVEMAKYKSRMQYLKQTNAKIKFLSCEPLLEDLGELDLTGIDWVICGGETGSNAHPMHPDWVRNIQLQCQKQNVPFFFKQWGEFCPPKAMFNVEKEFKTAYVFRNGVFDYNVDVANLFKDKYGEFAFMNKVGKTKSRALLDGKEYKEFPKGYEVRNDKI